MHEILTLIIIIGSCFQVKSDSVVINMVCFSGYAQGECFKGRILPGAVDTQTIGADGATRLSARYMLEGVDGLGDSCRIFIENSVYPDTPRGCSHPTIVTNSKLMSQMAKGSLTGRIDTKGDSLIIRILQDN